jgi:hypothetical protein
MFVRPKAWFLLLGNGAVNDGRGAAYRPLVNKFFDLSRPSATVADELRKAVFIRPTAVAILGDSRN